MHGLASLLSAFTAGATLLLYPCVLPLLMGYLSFTARESLRSKAGWLRRSFACSAGVIASLLVFGMLASTLFSFLLHLMPHFRLAIGALVLIMGLALLTSAKLPLYFPLRDTIASQSFYSRGFLFGLMLGVIAFPCGAPLVLSVVALTSLAELEARLLLTLAFCLGVCLTLTLLNFFPDLISRLPPKTVRKVEGLIERISGVVLTSVGLFLIATWA